MKPTEALKAMLESSGMSMYALSKKLGKSPLYVQNIVRRGGGIESSNLATMADAMGFRLMLKGDGEEIQISPKEKGDNADDHQGSADQPGSDS